MIYVGGLSERRFSSAPRDFAIFFRADRVNHSPRAEESLGSLFSLSSLSMVIFGRSFRGGVFARTLCVTLSFILIVLPPLQSLGQTMPLERHLASLAEKERLRLIEDLATFTLDQAGQWTALLDKSGAVIPGTKELLVDRLLTREALSVPSMYEFLFEARGTELWITLRGEQSAERRQVHVIPFRSEIVALPDISDQLTTPFLDIVTKGKWMVISRNAKDLFFNAPIPSFPVKTFDPKKFEIQKIGTLDLHSPRPDLVEGIDASIVIHHADRVISVKDLETGKTYNRIFSRNEYLTALIPSVQYYIGMMMSEGISRAQGPDSDYRDFAKTMGLSPQQASDLNLVSRAAFEVSADFARVEQQIKEALIGPSYEEMGNLNAQDVASELARLKKLPVTLPLKLTGQLNPGTLEKTKNTVSSSMTIASYREKFSEGSLLSFAQRNSLENEIRQRTEPLKRVQAKISDVMSGALNFVFKNTNPETVGDIARAMVRTVRGTLSPGQWSQATKVGVFTAMGLGATAAVADVASQGWMHQKVGFLLMSGYKVFLDGDMANLFGLDLSSLGNVFKKSGQFLANANAQDFIDWSGMTLSMMAFMPLSMLVVSMWSFKDKLGNAVEGISGKFLTLGFRIVSLTTDTIRARVLEKVLNQRNFFPLYAAGINPLAPMPGSSSRIPQGLNFPTKAASDAKGRLLHERHGWVNRALPILEMMHAKRVVAVKQGLSEVDLEVATQIRIIGDVSSGQASEGEATQRPLITAELLKSPEYMDLWRKTLPGVQAGFLEYISTLGDEAFKPESFDMEVYRFFEASYTETADRIRKVADNSLLQELKARSNVVKHFLSRKMIAGVLFGALYHGAAKESKGMSVSPEVVHEWKKSNLLDYFISTALLGGMFPQEYAAGWKVVTGRGAQLSNSEVVDGALMLSTPVEQVIFLATLAALSVFFIVTKNALLDDRKIRTNIEHIWNSGNIGMFDLWTAKQRAGFRSSAQKYYEELAPMFKALGDDTKDLSFLPKGRELSFLESFRRSLEALKIDPIRDPSGSKPEGILGGAAAHANMIKGQVGPYFNSYLLLGMLGMMSTGYWMSYARFGGMPPLGYLMQSFYFMTITSASVLFMKIVPGVGYTFPIPWLHYLGGYLSDIVTANRDLMTRLLLQLNDSLSAGSFQKKRLTEAIQGIKVLYRLDGQVLPDKFLGPSDRFSEKLAAELGSYMQKNPPLATRENATFNFLKIGLLYAALTSFLYIVVWKDALGALRLLGESGFDAAHVRVWMDLMTSMAWLGTFYIFIQKVFPSIIEKLREHADKRREQKNSSRREAGLEPEDFYARDLSPLELRRHELEKFARQRFADYDQKSPQEKIQILGLIYEEQNQQQVRKAGGGRVLKPFADGEVARLLPALTPPRRCWSIN